MTGAYRVLCSEHSLERCGASWPGNAFPVRTAKPKERTDSSMRQLLRCPMCGSVTVGRGALAVASCWDSVGPRAGTDQGARGQHLPYSSQWRGTEQAVWLQFSTATSSQSSVQTQHTDSAHFLPSGAQTSVWLVRGILATIWHASLPPEDALKLSNEARATLEQTLSTSKVRGTLQQARL